MAKQKLSFRSVPAAALTKRYQNTKLFFLCLHGITIIAAVCLLAAAALGKLTWFNAAFCAVTAVVLNWLISAFSKMKLAVFSTVLTTDCDPVKLVKVFAPLDKTPEKLTDVSLNVMRGLFYQGKWQEALDRLTKVQKPKENTPMYFQYYNLLACCYEQAKDAEKLFMIQQKIEKSVAKMKPRAAHIGNGRQLLSILDVMLTQQEGQISRCKEACKEMYDQASFALSRINVSLRLAQLEHLSGSNHSAVNRCEYIIDDGGTTFYVEEAKKLYVLCCGKEYIPDGSPRALPESLDELEDELYEDEDDLSEEDQNEDEDERETGAGESAGPEGKEQE